jgi:hypothetical protein
VGAGSDPRAGEPDSLSDRGSTTPFFYDPWTVDARLAMGSATTLSMFLLEIHEERKKP